MNLFSRRPRQPEVDLLDERALGSPSPRPSPPPPKKAAPAGQATAKPVRMQPPEDRYGYAVAALLFVAGIVFATVHGAGQAKHPDPIFPALGSVLAVLLALAIWRYRNRFASAMLAVLAAALVDTTKPPTDLVILDYLVIISAFIWAVWLTLRQSKATKALAASQPRLTPEQRRAQRKARKRGEEPASEGRHTPAASRRYTPPKPREPRKTRKELAASAAPRPKRPKQAEQAKQKRLGRRSKQAG